MIIQVPMDVIKERLQIEGQIKTEILGGSFHAFKQIVKTEGLFGLYRAYWIHQLTWAPFNGLYFLCYEECRKFTQEYQLLPSGMINNFASGLFAGTIASVATSPLDLVKTRLQVQQSNPTVFNYTVNEAH